MVSVSSTEVFCMALAPENFTLANYHAHTTRCQHARGTEEEYVLQAIETGFEILGFADHSAWPYRSDFVANMRMRLDELDGYVETVRALKEKYAGRIRIHLGMECEAFPEFYPWLREIRAKMGFDYFILGNHYDTNDETGGFYFGRCANHAQIRRYMETTIAGMESGLFLYLAHPDLFLHRYPAFDAEAKRVCRALCEAALRLDMPLEYNLLGHRRNPGARSQGYVGYTSREFWEVAAETGNRAIIGVDAHAPEDLDAGCAETYRRVRGMLQGMGVEVLDVMDSVEQTR